MENNTQQFDTTARIRTRMRTETEGLVEIALHWPADEAWVKRAKSRKVLTRLLGRGQQEADVEPGESDLEVYNGARCEGSPDLTAAEASRLIGHVAEARVVSSELGATDATVTLAVMKQIEVVHRLKIPTAKQVKDCSRAMDRFVGMPHNVFSNTLNLQATAALWGQLSPETENYAQAVPIIHKDAVMREVIQALDREVAEGVDESSF